MQKHQRRRVVRLRADHAVFKPLSRDIEKAFAGKRGHVVEIRSPDSHRQMYMDRVSMEGGARRLKEL